MKSVIFVVLAVQWLAGPSAAVTVTQLVSNTNYTVNAGNCAIYSVFYPTDQSISLTYTTTGALAASNGGCIYIANDGRTAPSTCGIGAQNGATACSGVMPAPSPTACYNPGSGYFMYLFVTAGPSSPFTFVPTLVLIYTPTGCVPSQAHCAAATNCIDCISAKGCKWCSGNEICYAPDTNALTCSATGFTRNSTMCISSAERLTSNLLGFMLGCALVSVFLYQQ